MPSHIGLKGFIWTINIIWTDKRALDNLCFASHASSHTDVSIYIIMRIYIHTYVGVCVSVSEHLYKHIVIIYKENKSLQPTSKNKLDSDSSANHLKERSSLNSIAETLYTYLALYKQIMKIIF